MGGWWGERAFFFFNQQALEEGEDGTDDDDTLRDLFFDFFFITFFRMVGSPIQEGAAEDTAATRGARVADATQAVEMSTREPAATGTV